MKSTTTVSLINMKGGVGKTTLTVNLAYFFAEYRPVRVLVVDLDPQFNASQYLLGPDKYQQILALGEPTVWDVFERNTRVPRRVTGTIDVTKIVRNVGKFGSGRLDLVPSRLDLAYSVKSPAQKEHELAKFLREMDENYDLVLIDCPPTESMLTTAAYLASDYLLVPVKPEYLSSIGLPLLIRSLDDFQDAYENSRLRLAGVVFNNMTPNTSSPEEVQSKADVRGIAEDNDWHVFRNEVPFSRRFASGARDGKPFQHTPEGRGNKDQEFFDFAKELQERLQLCMPRFSMTC
ncbi:MAG TPA: ParA family protein [Pirellulales bacterium]|nr:ParA family protein [Pirellulales bacterium]